MLTMDKTYDGEKHTCFILYVSWHCDLFFKNLFDASDQFTQ